MSLVVYYSDRGLQHHQETILPRIVDVNSIPGVGQREESFVDDHVCIVSMSTSKRPKLLVTETHVVGLEGDILNRESLNLIIGDMADMASSAIDYNGNFNLIIYDRLSHQLIAVNCRASLYNFYHHQLTDGHILASNIRSIVRCMDQAPEMDYHSLFNLFMFGFAFGDHTLVSAIKRFPQASIARAHGRNITFENYWKPEFANLYTTGMDGIVKEFNQRMIEATRLRFSYFGDITIFLTGGLDSRLIAAAAEKTGNTPQTLTYGFRESNDIKFGRMCAQRLGFPHHVYVTQPGESTQYSKLLSYIVWFTGASTNIASMTSMKYHAFLLNLGVKYYSHGSTIGSLSSRHNQPYMFYPVSDEKKICLTYDHLTGSQRETCLQIFSDTFFNQANRFSRSLFTDCFSSIRGKHFADKFVCWVMRHRLPNTVYNSIQVDNFYFNSIHFFLDKDLMDLYFRVPLIYRQESLWQKKACVTINKKIADVPHQMTGKPITTSLMVSYLDRLRNKLLRNTRFAYNVKHKDPRKDTLTDHALKTYLLDHIHDTGFMQDIFHIPATEKMIQDHFSGTQNHIAAILNLAAVIAFKQIFLDQRCQSFPSEAKSLLSTIPYPN